MILLREIQERDIPDLIRISNVPGLFNLTEDKDLLKEKIQRSFDSFSGKFSALYDSKYLFVAEDLDSKRVVATSMIAGQHGTESSPHFYFDIGLEKKFSETINTGFLHGTLKLKSLVNGPSEIGGLVVDRDHRNQGERVGRQIAFVRFLYLFLHPKRFKDQVIAELLPPLNKKGQSPLWEAIGRRFTNMDYWEADALCQKNKEFILSLFPNGKIYTTFLSAEARNAVGRVGKETEPVFHMLTKIGFKYMQQVDPFDGGPHLWADTKNISIVNQSFSGIFGGLSTEDTAPFKGGLISRLKNEPGKFSAVSVEADFTGGDLKLRVGERSTQAMTVLKLKPGEEIAFLPFY